MNLAQLAEQVTEACSVFVSGKEIERLLGAVATTGDLWEIVDKADFPVPAVFESLRALEREGLVTVAGDGIRLTPAGTEAARRAHTVRDLSCKYCEGRGLDMESFPELWERFVRAQKDRPSASHQFDQGYVTPSSTYSRFLIAYERGDVEGKDVFILGDDDLMSIVLGLSGLPNSITVVEIDERLLEFIDATARKEGFEVRLEQMDLRKALSPEHHGRYDTFFTDPPETLVAADAFVGRGIAALRAPGSAGYFGFTHREASLSKWHKLQKMLLDYNVVITDIVHNFNEYVNWGYEEDTKAWRLAPVKVRPAKNWYRSALYRLEALPGFKGNTKEYGELNIHEDAESSTT